MWLEEKSHKNHPKRFSNIWRQGRRAPTGPRRRSVTLRLRTAGSRCHPSTRSGFLRAVMRARSGGGAWRAQSAALFRWEPVSLEHWRLASECTTSEHTPPSFSWNTEAKKTGSFLVSSHNRTMSHTNEVQLVMSSLGLNLQSRSQRCLNLTTSLEYKNNSSLMCK